MVESVLIEAAIKGIVLCWIILHIDEIAEDIIDLIWRLLGRR